MNHQKILLDIIAFKVVEPQYDMPQWTKRNVSQMFL